VGGAALKYKGNAFDVGVGFNSKETPAGTFGVNAGYFLASGDDNTTNNSDDKSFHDFSLLGVNTSDRYFGEIFGKSNALGINKNADGTPLGQGVDGLNSGTNGQGLKVFSVGVNWKPAFVQKTSVKLDYYALSRDKDTLNNGPVGSKIGNEIDLTLGYQHSENVGFEAGYASLSSDEALGQIVNATTTGTQDTVTKLFARANIKWGGEEK
jgi:FlaG/FlaF family flagellin (archaellin)